LVEVEERKTEMCDYLYANMNIKYEILYVMHKNQSNCLYIE
jgi:hypothetical protein